MPETLSYVSRQALADFQATWSAVRKNGTALEKVVAAIARAPLCATPSWADRAAQVDAPGLQEFADSFVDACAEVCCAKSKTKFMWYRRVIHEISSGCKYAAKLQAEVFHQVHA